MINVQDKSIALLMPVYNVEKYLKSCIDSILQQIDEKTILYIMDDASTDNSYEILKSYNDYKNIIIFKSEVNKGVSAIRNYLIDKSKSDYIWFIDSDDVMNDGAFSHVLKCLIEFDEIGVICADYIYLKDDAEVYKKGFIGKEARVFANVKNDFIIKITKSNNNYLWNKIFSRKLIFDLYFKEGVIFEDIIYMTDISLKKFDYCYLKKPLIKYRQRAESQVRCYDYKYIEDYFYSLKYRIDMFNDFKYNSDYIYLLYKFYKQYIGFMLELTLLGRDDLLSYTYDNYHNYFNIIYENNYKYMNIHQKYTINRKRRLIKKIIITKCLES